ncbi:hypothetical protein RRG08_028869 [Elysia crispata]|uniref:Uncharacterized protein n=1 Tax=Elysia crispata TaxID=231223 RepID=A0AAE0Z0Z8_9GAST|nr:hypothetical protein RRG08_028869 [Elysia crispata]
MEFQSGDVVTQTACSVLSAQPGEDKTRQQPAQTFIRIASTSQNFLRNHPIVTVYKHLSFRLFKLLLRDTN